MYVIEQAKNHSKELIREWLVKYKFKEWKITETTNKKVTLKMKRQRAEAIADILADAGRWHSHGRGINLNVLSDEEIKLKVENFGEDVELNKLIRQYYDLLTDFCHKMRIKNAFHSETGITQLS